MKVRAPDILNLAASSTETNWYSNLSEKDGGGGGWWRQWWCQIFLYSQGFEPHIAPAPPPTSINSMDFHQRPFQSDMVCCSVWVPLLPGALFSPKPLQRDRPQILTSMHITFKQWEIDYFFWFGSLIRQTKLLLYYLVKTNPRGWSSVTLKDLYKPSLGSTYSAKSLGLVSVAINLVQFPPSSSSSSIYIFCDKE